MTAVDGREAVEVFRRHKSENILVLLDLAMPRMNGEEAFQEIRRIRSDARVILTSGHAEQEIINRFKGKGLAGFIQKPYKLQPLIDKIREVMES